MKPKIQTFEDCNIILRMYINLLVIPVDLYQLLTTLFLSVGHKRTLWTFLLAQSPCVVQSPLLFSSHRRFCITLMSWGMREPWKEVSFVSGHVFWSITCWRTQRRPPGWTSTGSSPHSNMGVLEKTAGPQRHGALAVINNTHEVFFHMLWFCFTPHGVLWHYVILWPGRWDVLPSRRFSISGQPSPQTLKELVTSLSEHEKTEGVLRDTESSCVLEACKSLLIDSPVYISWD